MNENILNDLKPQVFFKWFGEICKIPHGSGDEEKLANFIKNYAELRGYDCVSDSVGNVFMRVPASKDYESEPSILFQAHLDMVCEKDENVCFDFEKDAISLKISDGKLYADGTTLGADNAVGIATMLAIGDSEDILHPKLEFLFTVKEEIGLLGIRAFDMSLIKSRRMINMDCGDSHVIAVSSLGRHSANISKTFDTFNIGDGCVGVRIRLYGGLGGHSGLMARKGRACAGGNMGALLASVSDTEFLLSSLKSSETAILNECVAEIALPNEKLANVNEKLRNVFSDIKKIYEKTDPDIKLSVETGVKISKCISREDTQSVVNLLNIIKTTPYREDGRDNSILITLSVLEKFYLSDGNFSLNFSIRSSKRSDIKLLYANYERFAALFGFKTVVTDSYSGWNESLYSPFREKFISVHSRLYGYEPTLERVLGGIEVGIITGEIEDMDAVGIAPTARGAHTAKEHIILSETEDYWTLLTEVLKKK